MSGVFASEELAEFVKLLAELEACGESEENDAVLLEAMPAIKGAIELMSQNLSEPIVQEIIAKYQVSLKIIARLRGDADTASECESDFEDLETYERSLSPVDAKLIDDTALELYVQFYTTDLETAFMSFIKNSSDSLIYQVAMRIDALNETQCPHKNAVISGLVLAVSTWDPDNTELSTALEAMLTRDESVTTPVAMLPFKTEAKELHTPPEISSVSIHSVGTVFFKDERYSSVEDAEQVPVQ